jgi:hypothetical protein
MIRVAGERATPKVLKKSDGLSAFQWLIAVI